MWKLVSLVLPVLVPSWRFFKAIEPSPRVQWRLSAAGDAGIWREVYPRPQALPPGQMLRRLVWNPEWNEALFLVTCAERLQQDPTPDTVHALQERVARRISGMVRAGPAQNAVFRLLFVHRRGTEIVEDVIFTSDPFPVESMGA